LRATLEQSQHLLEEDPNTARRMLEEALAEHPDDPRLTAALEDARRRLDERQREQSIDQACRQTRLFLESREFDPALEPRGDTLATTLDVARCGFRPRSAAR